MKVRWCSEKNRILKYKYGISFGRLLQYPLVGIGHHPVRANQRMLFVLRMDYIWVIPFVIDEEELFLKTFYPSRKYTCRYREGRLNEKED